MKILTLVLLGWWFAVYPIDAPYGLTRPPDLYGPYVSMWQCVADALEIDMKNRRAFTSYCFLAE